MLNPNENPDHTDENSVKSSETPDTPETEKKEEHPAEDQQDQDGGQAQKPEEQSAEKNPSSEKAANEGTAPVSEEKPMANAEPDLPKEETDQGVDPQNPAEVSPAPEDAVADPKVEEPKDNPKTDIQKPAESESAPTGETGQPVDTPVETDGSESESEDQATPSSIQIPATPLTEEFLSRVDELSKDPRSVMEDVSAGELILLMQGLNLIDDIGTVIPKVGLARRSFDVLKRSQKVEHEEDDAFEDEVQVFNRRRQDYRKQQENARQLASDKKREILEKLNEIVEKQDPQLIKEVRDLQQEWREAGQALREDSEKLYEKYRHLLDLFYKQRELFFEMRDYDHRKNLEEKERLIKEADNLIPPEEDRQDVEVWREKIDLLSELQQQWKSVGHVPRDDMDRINESYKAAIDRFFDLRQDFMEVQEKLREENGEKKKALLEEVEKYSEFTAEKPGKWNEATRAIRKFQDEWKQIGPAPHSINSQLWGRYREVCKNFFGKKAEFFKKFDEIRNENLEKKRVLVERAEALKTSTDWEATAKELKKIQREWRDIGPVPGRHSNKLWSSFRSACDAFFEARRQHYNARHGDEESNLEAKRGLIDEVKKLQVTKETTADILVGRVKELQARWKEIGHVPFKEKDRVWEEFRSEIDKLFNQLSLKREEISRAKMASSIESIDDEDKRAKALKGRLARVKRRLKEAREKVEQYSTNIQLISKGKSGDALRAQIQGEIDKEKKVVEDLRKKVKLLNEWLKDPSKDMSSLGDEEGEKDKKNSAPQKEEPKTEEKSAEEPPEAKKEEPVSGPEQKEEEIKASDDAPKENSGEEKAPETTEKEEEKKSE